MKLIKTLYNANRVYLKELFCSGKVFIIVQMVSLALVSPANYLLAYAPKQFLDSILIDKHLSIAMLWILLYVAIQIYSRLSQFGLELLKKRNCSRAKIAAKKHTYSKLEYINLVYFEDASNITKVDKALSYCESGGDTLINLIVTLLTSAIVCGTLTVISFQFDWWIWIVIVIITIFQYFTDKYLRKLSFDFSMEQMKHNREQNYFNSLPTTKDAIAEIKLNNSMGFFLNKYIAKYWRNFHVQEKQERKVFSLNLLFSLPNDLFSISCYLLIGLRLLNGSSTVGDYSLFFAAIAGINSQIRVIIATINMFYEQYLSAKVYSDFMNDEECFIEDTQNELVEPIQNISFNNISFRYPGQNTNAVNKLTVSINKGERISVVGFNGAGKTTFIKLMSLLYMPNEGDISINGKPVNFSLRSYWSKLGVMFQNHQEFAISIKENLLLQNTDVLPDERVWQVLTDVGLAEKIYGQEKQIHAHLGRSFYDDGIELSGGERQKLAVARIINKNCDFYILDEPSSALDPLSEEQLYRCIENIPRDKTVIIISHRLSSISVTDRVLFFKDGNIIADGSHAHLIKTCEEYRAIYQMQSNKYIQTE